MPHKLIALYQNGNYLVKLYSDGTKIKQTGADDFIAEFPDSIDLKITNYCDKNCPMCHEGSSTLGEHAQLDAEFLATLKRGTELAIGGGNPLSHPQLEQFLERMSAQGIICNLTVNEKHLLENKERISHLIRNKLIYGLGISMQSYNEQAVEFARCYSNTVLHLINGVFMDYDKIADKGLRILILGYKKFGRGNAYFSPEIEKQIAITKEKLPSLFGKFRLISFDNLALEQLGVKELIGTKEYDNMYMGDDGEGSMYIDLVAESFARSSTSTKRYPLETEITKMFKKIQLIRG